MPDLVTSKVFVDGEKGITATKLNQIISGSVIQPDFYSAKPASPTLDSTDQLLELKSSGSYATITGAQIAGSVAGLVPLADATQNGMLRQVSGLSTDYVGGDNACHPLTPPQISTPDQSGLMPGARNRKQIYDDFTYPIAGSNTVTNTLLSTLPFPWTTTLSGAGATIGPSTNGAEAVNKAYGVWSGSNSSATNGRAAIYSALSLVGGLGALDIYCRVAFASIPTAAQNTNFRVGILDSFTYPNSIQLMMFYDSVTGAAVWMGETSQATVASNTSKAASPAIVAYSASVLSFYKLKISINAAWNSVTFYVNGITIGTLTTNIPTVLMPPFISADKTAGTIPNGWYIDDFAIDYQYSVP